MQFGWSLALVTSLTVATAAPFLKATGFLNPKPKVLTAPEGPEPKYFRRSPTISALFPGRLTMLIMHEGEARANGHCDFRFYKDDLDDKEHQEGLRLLAKTYLDVCSKLNVETWLMHGSLLGWWWGKKVSP